MSVFAVFPLHRLLGRSLAGALVVAVIAGCSSEPALRRSPPVVDGGILYGIADQTFLLQRFPVFRDRTALVIPDPEAVGYLRGLRRPITLTLFMGTWDLDAQTHVPLLLKALQEAVNRYLEVDIVGLNRRLEDRDGWTEHYQVTHSPTVMVESGGLEIGRVVGEPLIDLAADVAAIIRTGLGG